MRFPPSLFWYTGRDSKGVTRQSRGKSVRGTLFNPVGESPLWPDTSGTDGDVPGAHSSGVPKINNLCKKVADFWEVISNREKVWKRIARYLLFA